MSKEKAASFEQRDGAASVTAASHERGGAEPSQGRLVMSDECQCRQCTSDEPPPQRH